MTVLYRPNKLIRPGTLPGVNPNHPASQGCLLSMVSQNNSAINLISRITPTTAGTAPTQKLDGNLGNTGLFVGSNNGGWTFANTSSTSVILNFTYGLIYRPTATATTAWLCFSSTSNLSNGVGIRVNGANTFPQVFVAGGASASSSIATTNGVPYFLVCSVSCPSNGGVFTARWLIMNLNTGSFKTATSTITATEVAGNGNVTMGGTGVGVVADCNSAFAAGMFSPVSLDIPQILQWSKDPWAFWYPQFDYVNTLSGAQNILLGQMML